MPNNASFQSGQKPRGRLLFTGGGGAGSEALNRLFSKHYEVHFADADIKAKPFSITKKQWHQIPFATAPEFTEKLALLCQKHTIDLLIPGVDEELLLVAQAQEDMGCDVLVPPVDFIKIHLDKFISNKFLRDHGLPVPKTNQLLEQRQVSFPCIVKPRHGRGSRGVAVVHSEKELEAHIFLSHLPVESFIVQEYLNGVEYTVMMSADKRGNLCAVVPVRVEIKRGITLRAETELDERVIKACVAIHESFPVAGCYNIQLVKNENGVVKPFEVNPRISTTSCLGVAAGVDFIDVYRNQKVGTELLSFCEGLGLRRSWYNEFVVLNEKAVIG